MMRLLDGLNGGSKHSHTHTSCEAMSPSLFDLFYETPCVNKEANVFLMNNDAVKCSVMCLPGMK